MPCCGEGAALAAAFSYCVAIMIAGGETVHSVMMPVCRRCPSALNSAIMMHIWIFWKYPLPLLILLKSPSLPQSCVISWRRCQVPRERNMELFSALWSIEFDAKPSWSALRINVKPWNDLFSVFGLFYEPNSTLRSLSTTIHHHLLSSRGQSASCSSL